MSTVREDIAQVRKSVNSLGVDVKLPNQFIYSKLLDIAYLLIKREADTRKIHNSTELFKPFCVQMKRVPTITCSNLVIPGCSELSRSINKIPKAYLQPTGSILNIYNLNSTLLITQTQPSKYLNILKREFKGPQLYYWIEDDYLYLPHHVDAVMVRGLFINQLEVERFRNPDAKCLTFMESLSSIPDWLRMDVFRLAVQDIASITLRIPEDENPNGNSNVKN